MLAYAAHRRTARQLSPTALALILAGHGIGLALLITAKMDMPVLPTIVRTQVENIPLPKEPPPPVSKPVETPKPPQAPQSRIDVPPAKVPVSVDLGPTIPPGPTNDVVTSLVGKGPDLAPPYVPLEKAAPMVRTAARFATPSDRLRPPYPESRRHEEKGATLRLRLAIDERGRVTAVEPIGTADPEFLASARQHLIRYWRYKPATEDGHPVAATVTITLRFELEDA